MNGEIVKDFLTTTLTIGNEEFTDNEILISCLSRLCFCKWCPKILSKIKPYMVYEAFVSLRIYIGVIIHLIELCILMGMSNAGSRLYLAIGFAIPICVFLLVLVTFLVVYDGFLFKIVSKGNYKEDYDSCCSPNSDYKKVFKLSALFLVLFKIISFLVSLSIWVNSIDESNDYFNRGENVPSFERFFFAYAICDFGMTLFTIQPLILKLIITVIFIDWNCTPLFGLAYIFGIIIFFIITFSIVKDYFSKIAFYFVLFTVIILVVVSFLVTCVSCFWIFKKGKVEDKKEDTVKKRSSWAERLNFLSDVCNLFAILALMIYLSLFIAQYTNKYENGTTKSTQNQTSLPG
jgi:hypothetical protein